MPRPGISNADVVRAYVELIQRRRRPSLLNLRLQLGRGSYSTIAQRLQRLALVEPNCQPAGQSQRRTKSQPQESNTF